jgi:hypothetical protein
MSSALCVLCIQGLGCVVCKRAASVCFGIFVYGGGMARVHGCPLLILLLMLTLPVAGAAFCCCLFAAGLPSPVSLHLTMTHPQLATVMPTVGWIIQAFCDGDMT